MKPQLIDNVQDMEKLLEKLSLQTCCNTVSELTTNILDSQKQIFTQSGNKNAYNNNQFLMILFQALSQTTNPYFSLEVKLENRVG